MKSSRLVMLSFLSILMLACSALKASPREASSFLPIGNGLVEVHGKAPFHSFWVNESFQLEQIHNNFDKIFILPINTLPVEDLVERAKLKNKSLKQRRVEEIREVARYMSTKLGLTIADYPGKKLLLTQEVDEKTLVLELALVEVVPTNGAINLASNIAGFFIPGSGLASFAAQGSIAIEGIIRSGKNLEILAVFKDRESDKLAPFSVKDYQQYAHIQTTIDDWTRQIIEIVNNHQGMKVNDSLPFTLIPY